MLRPACVQHLGRAGLGKWPGDATAEKAPGITCRPVHRPAEDRCGCGGCPGDGNRRGRKMKAPGWRRWRRATERYSRSTVHVFDAGLSSHRQLDHRRRTGLISGSSKTGRRWCPLRSSTCHLSSAQKTATSASAARGRASFTRKRHAVTPFPCFCSVVSVLPG